MIAAPADVWVAVNLALPVWVVNAEVTVPVNVGEARFALRAMDAALLAVGNLASATVPEVNNVALVV